MNQIINMVLRIIMRRVLSKGVDAGFKKAGALRGARKQQPPAGLREPHNNQTQTGPTREEVRAARRARRQNNTST
jgi:hypothetical protein